VAARGCVFTTGIGNRDGEGTISPRRSHVGPQPFYIPAKVPENEEVLITTTSLHGEDERSIDSAIDVIEMDFEFETEGGTWISAQPIVYDSKSNVSTTTTSTLMDGQSRRSLTVDTSVGSSTASLFSSLSTFSATTDLSDIYGWEEELDRKSSIENYSAWDQNMDRRLPSGGRTFGPRIRSGDYKSGNGKRKSLLYRVLNLSGRREDATIARPEACSCPSTST